MKRCDICLDQSCEGKKDCHCETCKVVDKCYRFLSPTIRITTKCTQECSHCCFSCSPKKDDMMTIESAIKIGKFLKSNHIKYAQIMGGEFFLNPDWVKVINEFAKNINFIRVVSNGDWAENKKESDKVIAYFSENENIKISISKDSFHTNKNVDKAVEICFENGIYYNLACDADRTTNDDIVPVGRSLYDCGFFGMFSCWCQNPTKKYSFLIDEKELIYKCPFGVWNYAEINDYLNGDFSRRFKEFGEKFYDVFITSCRSCVSAYQNTRRKEKI
jgi:MoaA/NifB/PqqE/SkfB family radical SAM enzyme